MPVVINFKICDNAEACNALNVCPTGAFRWNDEKKTLEVDDNKCINCGLCATSENSCEVGAIKFAKTQEELKKIKSEINSDPRTIADLMVDRYGSQPINMPFYCTEDDLSKVLTTSKMCFIELINEDVIECLIKSIPIKEIINSTVGNCLYRKVEVKSGEVMKNYNIEQLPALLIFKDNNLLGKVEGYYSVNQTEEFLNKIKEVL